MNIHPDLDDDLSSAMATETLLAHGLVPEGLPASSSLRSGRFTILGGKVPGSRPKRESESQLEDVQGLAR